MPEAAAAAVRRQSARRAAARAVALWVGGYAVWAHCLVAWKWMTPPPPAARGGVSSGNPTGSHKNNSTALPGGSGSETDVEMQDLQRALRQLDAAAEEARTAAAELRERAAQLGRLAREVEQISTASKATTAATSSSSSGGDLLKVRNLLRIPNLSELRSGSQVGKHFAQAIGELEQLILPKEDGGDDENNSNNNWRAAAAYFATSDFPPRSSGGDSAGGACRASGGSGGGVTRADLEAAQDRLERTFASQRSGSHRGGLPVSFPETVERRRAALLEASRNLTTIAAAVAATAATQSATTSSTRSGSQQQQEGCLKSPRQVLPWMDAGVDAIYKKGDVRAALLRALQEDGVDTGRILLDADLDDDDDNGRRNLNARRRRQPSSFPSNLRQWLDTPALREGSAWVDRLLDAAGGLHDGLDDALDRLVYARVGGDADDRAVGRAVVAHLLRRAGRVPIPEAVWKKYA